MPAIIDPPRAIPSALLKRYSFDYHLKLASIVNRPSIALGDAT